MTKLIKERKIRDSFCSFNIFGDYNNIVSHIFKSFNIFMAKISLKKFNTISYSMLDFNSDEGD